MKNFKESLKAWWNQNKGAIVLVGGAAAYTALIVMANKVIKKIELETLEEYEPLRLFDRFGTEYRLFKWDTGCNNDPNDIIYYPAEQVVKDVNWDEL